MASHQHHNETLDKGHYLMTCCIRLCIQVDYEQIPRCAYFHASSEDHA